MPRSPAMVSIGSPGIRRINTNTSKVIPMNVGTTRLNLVSANRSMPGSVVPGREDRLIEFNREIEDGPAQLALAGSAGVEPCFRVPCWQVQGSRSSGIMEGSPDGCPRTTAESVSP